MGLRLVLLILAIWVVYSVIRRNLRRNRNATHAPPEKRPVVDMVRCQHCGTHLPAPESIQRDGKHYCSRAHLEADRRLRHDDK
jgi:uncharacterized protein